MRGCGAEGVERELATLGFVPASLGRAGDVMVAEPAAGLRHLAVVTGAGTLVHAHAGLRRVVEGPADPAWTTIGYWRQGES